MARPLSFPHCVDTVRSNWRSIWLPRDTVFEWSIIGAGICLACASAFNVGGLAAVMIAGVGACAGALLALGVSLLLYVVPVQMPPPPGSTRGYPLNINIDPLMYFITVVAMVVLAMLASAWIARKTVHTPIVEALAHT